MTACFSILTTFQNERNVQRARNGCAQGRYPSKHLWGIGRELFCTNKMTGNQSYNICFHGNNKRDCFDLHQQATSCFNVKRQLAWNNLCVVNSHPTRTDLILKTRKKKSNFPYLYWLPSTHANTRHSCHHSCHTIILQWFLRTFSHFKWSHSWSSTRQRQENL